MVMGMNAVNHGDLTGNNWDTKRNTQVILTNRTCGFLSIWVNYNELTASSLEIIVSKGNHPQMALIQVSELL